MQWRGIFVLVCSSLGIVSCGTSGEEADTTTAPASANSLTPSTAATTTAAPAAPPTTAITTQPVTAVVTTVPKTSAAQPSTPTDGLTAAITQRYLAFHTANDQCTADPAACDFDTQVGIFFSAGADTAQQIRGQWEEYKAKKQRIVGQDQITRKVFNVRGDASEAISSACVKNGAQLADENGNIVDDSVFYWEEDVFWRNEGGSWVIAGADVFNVGSEPPCEL